MPASPPILSTGPRRALPWIRRCGGRGRGAGAVAGPSAGLVARPPTGLAVDQEMRWSVAVRWVALGLEGADARVAAERKRDPSDRGDRAVVTATVARPDTAAKQ